jgi:hypothetical protein
VKSGSNDDLFKRYLINIKGLAGVFYSDSVNLHYSPKVNMGYRQTRLDDSACDQILKTVLELV